MEGSVEITSVLTARGIIGDFLEINSKLAERIAQVRSQIGNQEIEEARGDYLLRELLRLRLRFLEIACATGELEGWFEQPTLTKNTSPGGEINSRKTQPRKMVSGNYAPRKFRTMASISKHSSSNRS